MVAVEVGVTTRIVVNGTFSTSIGARCCPSAAWAPRKTCFVNWLFVHQLTKSNTCLRLTITTHTHISLEQCNKTHECHSIKYWLDHCVILTMAYHNRYLSRILLLPWAIQLANAMASPPHPPQQKPIRHVQHIYKINQCHWNLRVSLQCPSPQEIRPYWGIINHHLPLIRPY